MKRTKTLVAEILSLVCELVVVGFSGYMGYLFLLIWSLSGASAEAISILILMLVMVLMVLVGIVDFIMSCVSFGAVSCNEESYQKKRKLLTTSSIFKLVLGAGSVSFSGAWTLAERTICLCQLHLSHVVWSWLCVECLCLLTWNKRTKECQWLKQILLRLKPR